MKSRTLLLLIILLVLVFNRFSGYEIIIRSKLDGIFILPHVELNQDCWQRCLKELWRYQNFGKFKDLKLIIGEVEMVQGENHKKIGTHAILQYTTPAGNTVLYDPMSDRQIINYKDGSQCELVHKSH